MTDPLQRSHFRHLVPVTLHWGDMDALGHVNNAVYFRYVETGRISYFDEVSDRDPAIWGGTGPILASIECTFRAQLRHPAEIEVATRTTRLGGKSLTLQAAVFVKGADAPVATSSAVVVWFDYGAQATVAIPGGIRERITALEAVPPAA
jgi:acyl-CoA thioester hydrolase